MVKQERKVNTAKSITEHAETQDIGGVFSNNRRGKKKKRW